MDFLSPEFFSAVGFPAAICAYTLFGIKPSLDKLTNATVALTEEIKERGKEQDKKIESLSDEIKALKFKVENLEALKNERR